TNATGGDTLNNLPALNTWVTFARPGSNTLSGWFTPYGTPVPFSFSSTGIGDENLWLLDTGFLKVDLGGSSLPVQRWFLDRETNNIEIPVVFRQGDTPVLNLKVRNVGSLISRMSGDVNGQSFSGLGSSESLLLSMPFANVLPGTNDPRYFRVSTD